MIKLKKEPDQDLINNIENESRSLIWGVGSINADKIQIQSIFTQNLKI
jgi:hypothetical protein